MNEDEFIGKVEEYIDQAERRLTSVKAMVIDLELWLETLRFFIIKRREAKETFGNVEADRADFFKARHDEDHLRLEMVKSLMESFPRGRLDHNVRNFMLAQKWFKELEEALK